MARARRPLGASPIQSAAVLAVCLLVALPGMRRAAAQTTPTLTLSTAQPTGNTNTSTVVATALLTNAGAPVADQPIAFSTVGTTGNSTVNTNATGYAVAAAQFPNPGFYNASATYVGNATLGLSGAVALSPVSVAENTVLSASVLPTNANTDHTFAFTAVLSLDSTMLAGGQAINFDFGDGTSQTAVTSDNGVALAAHQYAAVGIYTVNLTFAGNASYSNPNGGSFPIVGSYFAGTINVSAVAVPTTMQLLILPPVAVTPASVVPHYLVGDALTAVATLTATATGQPAAGVLIAFTDGTGAIIGTATTNSSGVATQPFAFTLPGNYTLVANVSQADSTQYGLSTASVSPVFVLDQTSMTLTQPPGTCGTLCESYTGSLVAALTTVPAGAVITFNFGDPANTTLTTTTALGGAFGLNFTYPAPGTYIASVSFAGSPTSTPGGDVPGAYLLPANAAISVTIGNSPPGPPPAPGPPTPPPSPGAGPVDVQLAAMPAAQKPPSCTTVHSAQTFKAQVAPQNWRRSGPPPAPQGTCTFVLFDDKAGSGVSLGTVAVWPPTQWPQLDKEAGVCMLQLSQSIPAGSYSVQVVYESTNGFSNGRAVLHGFEVSHLCALHIQEKLADLGQFLTG